jgi:hypothetical protein
VMLHRRIVGVSTKAEQKKNTERRKPATERFHGSLRYGLSLIRESHELLRRLIRPRFEKNGIPISAGPSLFGRTVAFLFVTSTTRLILRCSTVDSLERDDQRIGMMRIKIDA